MGECDCEKIARTKTSKQFAARLAKCQAIQKSVTVFATTSVALLKPSGQRKQNTIILIRAISTSDTLTKGSRCPAAPEHPLALGSVRSSARRTLLKFSAKAAAAAALCSVAASTVRANPRTTRLIALEPGAQSDNVARLFQPVMERSLGQEVIVENHGGAGGRIGARLVAISKADGHTLGVGGANNLVLAGLIGRDIGYDPTQDFTFIGSLARMPFAVGVHPALPIHDIAGLIRFARANPGRLNFGSAGIGGSSHLALEAIAQHHQIDLLHVPFRGSSHATNELVGGRIDVVATDLHRLLPLAAGNKLRVIALTGSTRAKSAPHIPTLHEQGLTGFYLDPWYGLFGPKNLDRSIGVRWLAAAHDAFNDRTTQARAEATGIEMVVPSAETLVKWIESDRARYGQLAKKLDLRSIQ
jgi:tripartite-type tricarboxylate transporter receptor subunit TctC